MARLRVDVLDPFPLAPRIVSEDHIALQSQILLEVLIRVVRLSVLRVTYGGENRWKRSSSRGRHIKVGRNIDARNTLENDLFDPVSLPLDLTCNPGIEGLFLQGCPEKLPEFRADHVDACLRLRRRCDCSETRQALLACFVHSLYEVLWPIVPEISLGAERRHWRVT
jgi:hypothetical protein